MKFFTPKDETISFYLKRMLKMLTINFYFQEATAATTEADADRVASTAIIITSSSSSSTEWHAG